MEQMGKGSLGFIALVAFALWLIGRRNRGGNGNGRQLNPVPASNSFVYTGPDVTLRTVLDSGMREVSMGFQMIDSNGISRAWSPFVASGSLKEDDIIATGTSVVVQVSAPFFWSW